jgi:hypothetical protein
VRRGEVLEGWSQQPEAGQQTKIDSALQPLPEQHSLVFVQTSPFVQSPASAPEQVKRQACPCEVYSTQLCPFEQFGLLDAVDAEVEPQPTCDEVTTKTRIVSLRIGDYRIA